MGAKIGEKIDAAAADAKAAGEQGARAALDATQEALVDGATRTKDWVLEAHEDGTLRTQTLESLSKMKDGIGSVVDRGAQIVPVAAELGRVLYAAVDKDVDLEPIYQDLEDAAARAELDARIADMPRVETIDGVDVGFSRFDETDASHSSSGASYLVMWRSENKLIGFVYRSRTDIDIDQLVAEAPRLVAAARKALEGENEPQPDAQG